MVFKQFMIFAAVARHRNLTRASQELRISQPGVSQQLKLLEGNYGIKLFKRSGRGVELTDAGRLFLSKITPILGQVDELNRSFDSKLPAPQAESLAVGGTHSTSAFLLPSLLAVFKKSRPEVGLTLRTGGRDAVERLVLTSEVELALVTGYPRFPQLDAERYRRERLVVFAAKNHPLARKRNITLRELGRVPLVIRGGKNLSSATESILRQNENQGLQLNIALRCESPESVKAAVREGIGVGILFEDAVTAEIRKNEFKALKVKDVKLEGESWIIYRRDKPLSSLAQEFLALLRKRRDKEQGSALVAGSFKPESPTLQT